MDNKDFKIKLQYAQALYFSKQVVQAKRLMKQVLKQHPDNAIALNVLALDASQHHHYQQAIDYWESMLVQFPAQSEQRSQLLKAIADAQLAAKSTTTN